jgi:hypothetical protein
MYVPVFEKTKLPGLADGTEMKSFYIFRLILPKNSRPLVSGQKES